MVLRYTRTRSVDPKPVVSASRRGERTPRVSLGEDCNSVTMCLRPCLLVGCNRRLVAGGYIRRRLAGSTGSPGRHVGLVVPCGTSCPTASTGPCVPCGAHITANPQAVRSVTPGYPGM